MKTQDFEQIDKLIKDLDSIKSFLSQFADLYHGVDIDNAMIQAIELLEKAYKRPKQKYIVMRTHDCEMRNNEFGQVIEINYVKLHPKPAPDDAYSTHYYQVIKASSLGEALDVMIDNYCPNETYVEIYANGHFVVGEE